MRDLGIVITIYAAVVAAVLWYLPAFVANAAPVLIARISFIRSINTPIWPRGLGAHKTWAGLLGGVLAGVAAGWIVHAFDVLPSSMNDDGTFVPVSWLLWSALISLGALIGDIVKSYAKRRIGIAPGNAWPVIDGIDYVVGALLFGLVLFIPSWPVAVALLVAGPILSLLANVFSYVIGLKKVWY